MPASVPHSSAALEATLRSICLSQPPTFRAHPAQQTDRVAAGIRGAGVGSAVRGQGRSELATVVVRKRAPCDSPPAPGRGCAAADRRCLVMATNRFSGHLHLPASSTQ